MDNFTILGIICIFLSLSCICKIGKIIRLKNKLNEKSRHINEYHKTVNELVDERFNLMSLLVVSNLDLCRKTYPVYDDDTPIQPLDKVTFQKDEKTYTGIIIPNITRRCQINGNEPFLIDKGYGKLIKLRDVKIKKILRYKQY